LVAIPHVVVLMGALTALLCLSYAVAAILRADQPALRRVWRRRDPGEIRQLQRVDRELNGPMPPELPAAGPLPCIEQIAAELQRLARQRRSGPTTESTVWLAAVLLAYDEWLRLACRSLGVTEHLQPLEGLDREAERLRLETELQANGVPLPPTQ
jgi:hypothetical protein